MRTLIVTNLFPSAARPGYAPFNRQQFRALKNFAHVDVFGVVPLRPEAGWIARALDQRSRVETIDGLRVVHPYFMSIPGLPGLNAGFLAASLLPETLWAMRKGRYDVILAAYAYPDGCAGVVLGQILGIPVVVKCHGSDLNRAPEDPLPRLQLERLLPRAARVVTVSRKLRAKAMELGVPEAKLRVVYNGIDRKQFFVRDKAEARAQLHLPQDRSVVLYVGHLAEHKGAGDLLDAARALSKRSSTCTVVFVGDGPLAQRIGDAAEKSGGAIVAVGPVPHQDIGLWMSAADLLCLPSWDEGMPNVVREAHACGRPVIATDVGGIPEAVHSQELGRLVPPRSPALLAEALAEALEKGSAPPESIVRLAVVPSWEESAASLFRVLDEAVRSRD